MKRLISFIFSLLFFLNTYAQLHPDEVSIRGVLAKQQKCWNTGNLDCFMEGYWESKHLVYIGSSGVSYGWKKTLANYKKRYPNQKIMGKLSFDLISVKPLSDDLWTVIGKWSLQREQDNPNGYFSLIFRRLGNEWVIISDHSS